MTSFCISLCRLESLDSLKDHQGKETDPFVCSPQGKSPCRPMAWLWPSRSYCPFQEEDFHDRIVNSQKKKDAIGVGREVNPHPHPSLFSPAAGSWRGFPGSKVSSREDVGCDGDENQRVVGRRPRPRHHIKLIYALLLEWHNFSPSSRRFTMGVLYLCRELKVYSRSHTMNRDLSCLMSDVWHS